MNAGEKQYLVGVDISQAGDKLLIEDGRFYLGAPSGQLPHQGGLVGVAAPDVDAISTPLGDVAIDAEFGSLK